MNKTMTLFVSLLIGICCSTQQPMEEIEVTTPAPTETTFVRIDTSLDFVQVYDRPVDDDFEGTINPGQSVEFEACFQMVMTFDSVFEVHQKLYEYKKPVLELEMEE